MLRKLVSVVKIAYTASEALAYALAVKLEAELLLKWHKGDSIQVQLTQNSNHFEIHSVKIFAKEKELDCLAAYEPSFKSLKQNMLTLHELSFKLPALNTKKLQIITT